MSGSHIQQLTTVEAKALPNGTEVEVEKFFVQYIFLRHGASEVLVIDRGTAFMAEMTQAILHYKDKPPEANCAPSADQHYRRHACHVCQSQTQYVGHYPAIRRLRLQHRCTTAPSASSEVWAADSIFGAQRVHGPEPP